MIRGASVISRQMASADLDVEDSDQAGEYQVSCDDVVEDFREDEDADIGDERHDVGKFNVHGL